MIVRAPVIVTMNGAPIVNSAVRINRDRIEQIGKAEEFAVTDEQVIDLDGHILLPGLINAHCHLEYTCLRGKIAPRDSFTDWIRAINAEKAKLTETDYLRSINDGVREALRFGTTSLVNLEAFPELMPPTSFGPLRIWRCPELIDVSAPGKSEQITAAATSVLAERNSCGGRGLAPHALYTASADLIERCIEIATAENLLLSTHLAESREEMKMFRGGAGPLFEFLRSLGRDMFDCGGATPLKRFLQIIRDPSTSLRSAQDDRGRDDAAWIIAHLNELAESDFDLLAALKKKFSIAHCPRSHAYFRHSPFPFEKLHRLGFNICLATDSLASNADLSLFAEMREFQKSFSRLPAEQIFEMVTVNPALAFGRDAELGRIAPGHFADLIALPFHATADIYQQIITFSESVPWMMLGGEVL